MPSPPYAVLLDGQPVEYYTHGDSAYKAAKRLAVDHPGRSVDAVPEWVLSPEQRVHELAVKKLRRVRVETLDLFTQEWRPI
jgi:hypothetical protein